MLDKMLMCKLQQCSGICRLDERVVECFLKWQVEKKKKKLPTFFQNYYYKKEKCINNGEATYT